MSLVTLGIEYFPDPSKGRPVFQGFIYVGEPDTDPEIPSNQKQVSLKLENGSILPVAQPLRTGGGGVVLYNGSPVAVIVDGDFSLKVLNRLGAQVYYEPNRSSLIDAGQVGLTVNSKARDSVQQYLEDKEVPDYATLQSNMVAGDYADGDIVTVTNDGIAGLGKIVLDGPGGTANDGYVIITQSGSTTTAGQFYWERIIQFSINVKNYAELRALNSSDLADGQLIRVSENDPNTLFSIKTGTVTQVAGVREPFTDDSNRYAERDISNGQVYLEWGGTADYNPSTHAGTDNTTVIEAYLNYVKDEKYTLNSTGFYAFDTAILIQGDSVRVRMSDVIESAWYYRTTTGDALTFKDAFGCQFHNFILLGGYNVGTATTNKGLVLRQCSYVKSYNMSIGNFQDCMHQDGGYICEHNDLENSNWQRSPLRYTYNEYSDTAVGVAHNKYNDAVFAHEINGAGSGVVLKVGEITFENPRGEDYGQEFFFIDFDTITIKNIYINNPVTRSDVSGVNGRSLRIKGIAGQNINHVYITEPDFLVDSGFNIIEIDGPLVAEIDIHGGKIIGGEYGLLLKNGCSSIRYTPDICKNHQLNSVKNESNGTLNYIAPAQILSSNLSTTLTGNDRAHILITGQNCFVDRTVFFDAFNTIQYGVSRPAGVSANVLAGTLYDYSGGLVAVTLNVNKATENI